MCSDKAEPPTSAQCSQRRASPEPHLADELRALPLVADDIYLQTQAFNLGVVGSISPTLSKGD